MQTNNLLVNRELGSKATLINKAESAFREIAA